MYRVARFVQVSLEQFLLDCQHLNLSTEQLTEYYNNIKLPKRGTRYSAGYDFFSPIPFSLNKGETIKIPTGVRCTMVEDWVMLIFPRSGLGFKYRMQLDNTVGVIDSDYYFSDNEGHIMIKATNDSIEEKTLNVTDGGAFAQGIFLNYGLTVDDHTEEMRNGGFGSTSK